MKKYVLGLVALAAAQSFGTANACPGTAILNGFGNPRVVYGNVVKIWVAGESGEAYYLDGALLGYFPYYGDPYEWFQFTMSVNLPYGAHSVRVSGDACTEHFTVSAEPSQPTNQNQKNVYRFYSQNQAGTYADHWSTVSFSEGIANGTYENRLFKLYKTAQDANMVPLYRCRAGGDHYASTSSTCEQGNTVNEGTYGYISNIPRAGFIPLYRFYRTTPTWDHIETTDWNEVVNWGTYGTTLGYVPQ